MPTIAPSNRFWRQVLLLAKSESQYGEWNEPSPSVNGLVAANLKIQPVVETDPRGVMRQYFGASALLPGAYYAKISFSVELWPGAGVTGSPRWTDLYLGCGWARTLVSGVMTEVTPATPGDSGSLSLAWYDAGLLHKLIGSRLHGKIVLEVGKIPRVELDGYALYHEEVAATPPAASTIAWQRPQAISDRVAQPLVINGGYRATNGLIVAGDGVQYKARSLTIDQGEALAYTDFVGGPVVAITNREITGQLVVDMGVSDELLNLGRVVAAEYVTLGWVFGSTSTQEIEIFGQRVQLLAPQPVEVNGLRLVQFDVRFLPVYGGDELVIAVRAKEPLSDIAWMVGANPGTDPREVGQSLTSVGLQLRSDSDAAAKLRLGVAAGTRDWIELDRPTGDAGAEVIGLWAVPAALTAPSGAFTWAALPDGAAVSSADFVEAGATARWALAIDRTGDDPVVYRRSTTTAWEVVDANGVAPEAFVMGLSGLLSGNTTGTIRAFVGADRSFTPPWAS